MNKKQFLKMIAELTAEEKEMVKGILTAEESAGPAETEEVDEKIENKVETPTEETEEVEVKETTEPANEESEDPDEDEEVEEVATEEEVDEETTDTEDESDEADESEVVEEDDDYIPEMIKGAAPFDEELGAYTPEPTEQPIVDTDGNEMPIDYESIIDGLNAKLLAAEAENKRLKSENTRLANMSEGAFGFSAKPQGQVKVNRLYDDCADIKFRK